MTIDLSRLVNDPISKWIDFDVSPSGKGVLRRTTSVDEDGKPLPESKDVRLCLKYMKPRAYRAMLEAQIDRKPKTRGGAKALTMSEEKARRVIVQELVLDWHLTARGAFAMGLAANMGAVDGDDLIDFNAGNLKVMTERSELPGVVDLALNDNSFFFDMPKGAATDEDEAEDADEDGDKDEKSDEDGDDDKTEDSLGNSGSGPSGSSAASPARTASPTP